MLIEGGYVVTNAHVVWPFDRVRVLFSDGSEFPDSPVLTWDLVGDLAVIGPLQTAIEPVALVDGEDLAIGSEVFLIGYTRLGESSSGPTLSVGLISGSREWEPLGMTYFQTDAPVGGDQRGGVLVSEKGEVIGLYGFTYTEAGFGHVASAADVLPRVEGLIAGVDVAGLGDRRVPLEGQPSEYEFTLRNEWDVRSFVVTEPAGTLIDLEVTGEGIGSSLVFGAGGEVFMFGIFGLAFLPATTKVDAPYFVIPQQKSESPGDYRVSSSRGLVPYNDVDDGVSIAVGQTVLASIDHPADQDYFVVDLDEGETIEITADSVTFDPFIRVDFPGALPEQLIFEDDSGGGMFGLKAQLIYKAPNPGSYLIVIESMARDQVGGYFLTVAQASAEATQAQFASTTGSAVEHYDRGRGLAAQERYDEAVAEFNEAIRLRPRYISAHIDRGLSHRKLEQAEQAIQDFGKAISLDPRNDVPYSNRGVVYYDRGELRLAMLDFEEAVRLTPFAGTSYNNRALVHIAQGNLEQALADVTRALELRSGSFFVLDTRAYVYLKLGRYDEAKLDYEELFSREEQSAYQLLGGGLAYASLGESDKAVGLLEQGLEEAKAETTVDPQLADLIAMAEEALAGLR